MSLELSPAEAQALVNIRIGGIANREDRVMLLRIKAALWKVGIRKTPSSTTFGTRFSTAKYEQEEEI